MEHPRISRRQFATVGAAAFASIGIIKAPAKAATPQFSYKYGNDQTESSPVTVRARQMWKAIEQETNGRLVVETFPNSVLGGDSQMISQLRSGAVQFLTEPGALLGGIVPAAQIDGVAFAFKDTKQAFDAMDGELGEYVRQAIIAKGIYCIQKPMDNGFREITANTPVRNDKELDGLKIRVPNAPIFVDTFRALGASPTPINVSELYTSLQTHVVDAEENALININQSKLYEVQKTLNFSNHAWSCWWFIANMDAWKALPADIQEIVTRNVAKYSTLQRADFAKLTTQLTQTLQQKGMKVYQCDIPSFKAKLGGYYAKWKNEFGTAEWTLLEKYTGKLAA